MLRNRWSRLALTAVALLIVLSVLDHPATAEPGSATDVLQQFVATGRLSQVVLDRIVAGGSADAIIVFDDRRIQQSAETRKALRGLVLDDAEELRLKALDLAALKSASAAVAGAGITTVQEYPAFADRLVRIDGPLALISLLAAPNVARVVENAVNRYQLAESLPLINQPAAAAAGYTGAGVSVAVIDTGVNYTDGAFGCPAPNYLATPGCRVAFTQDFTTHVVGGQTTVFDDGALDDDGHGTHVSAIAAAVAPASKVLGLDVFQNLCDGNGQNCTFGALDSDILSAIQWVIDHQGQYKVAAVNLSLAVSGTWWNITCDLNAYDSPFRNLRAVGVLPVASAGNEFKTSTGKHLGVAKPACTPGAVRVGAVYDANVGGIDFGDCADNTTAADKVVCTSQTGNTLSLLAPGCIVVAASIAGCGTSQAAPHVAGAVAVLAAAAPTSSAATRECALTSSGPLLNDTRQFGGNPLNVARRRLDLGAAVTAATNGSPCLAPDNKVAGSAAFTLTVTGTGFVTGMKVKFNLMPYTPASVTPTQIQVVIPASEVAEPGQRTVQVCPASGFPCMPPGTFTVVPVPPSLTSLTPNHKDAGTPQFTLTLTGSNFFAGSLIYFGGVLHQTTYNNDPSHISTQIMPGDISTPGPVDVQVCNSPGNCSTVVVFTVDVPPNPVPTVTSLDPQQTVAGSPSFELTVGGTGFIAGSKIWFGAVEHATTVDSSIQARTTIAASEVATAGNRDVKVCSPAPGGGCSQAVVFTATMPPPFPPIFLTVGSNTTLGGQAVTKQDIIRYDGSTYSIWWDGSDHGLGSKTIDGFQVLPDGSILIGTKEGVVLTVDGVSNVPITAVDIVKWVPDTPWVNTSGHYESFFAGSDAGLTPPPIENLGGFFWDSAKAKLYLTFSTSWTLNWGPELASTKSGSPRDVAVCKTFAPRTRPACGGGVAMFFKGVNIGLTTTEKLDSFFLAGTAIYMSTSNSFTLEPFALSGESRDAFACRNFTSGISSTCGSVDIAFSGAARGVLANVNVTGYAIAPP